MLIICEYSMKKILSVLTLSMLATAAVAGEHVVEIKLSDAENSSSVTSSEKGTVTFNAVVTQSTCNVAGDSLNKVVDLGSVESNALKGFGAAGTDKEFTLKLTDCPANYRSYENGEFGKFVSKVGIQFDKSGKNIADNGQYLKNTISWENNGGAKDVAVQILNESKGVINLKTNRNNAESSLSKDKANHEFQFYARLLSVADEGSVATAGKFSSSIPFSITYK